jgi:predicted nucleotidyltransferase
MNKQSVKITLAKHGALLHKYGVKSLALFGSVVRGEARRGSDIDFLVEFKKPTFDNYIGLLHALEDLFGKDIDLVTRAALNKRLRPFVLKEAEYFEIG